MEDVGQSPAHFDGSDHVPDPSRRMARARIVSLDVDVVYSGDDFDPRAPAFPRWIERASGGNLEAHPHSRGAL